MSNQDNHVQGGPSERGKPPVDLVPALSQSPALVGAKIRRGWVWSMLFAYDSVTVSLTSVVQILKS